MKKAGIITLMAGLYGLAIYFWPFTMALLAWWLHYVSSGWMPSG